MNQSNVQRRILAKAKPKRQSDATSDQSRRESMTQSDRLAVESRNQVSTMNQKSKRLEEVKLENAATSANLAITNAQAKDAMARARDESHELVIQSQMQS